MGAGNQLLSYKEKGSISPSALPFLEKESFKFYLIVKKELIIISKYILFR